MKSVPLRARYLTPEQVASFEEEKKKPREKWNRFSRLHESVMQLIKNKPDNVHEIVFEPAPKKIISRAEMYSIRSSLETFMKRHNLPFAVVMRVKGQYIKLVEIQDAAGENVNTDKHGDQFPNVFKKVSANAE